MKRILFDLTKVQPVNGSKFHGGGKYGIVVFKRLVELAPERVAAFYDENSYIDSSVIDLCSQNNIPVIKKSEKSVTDAAKMFGSVLYSPLFDQAYLKDQSVQALVTIHDMRPLEMVGDEYEKYYAHKRKFAGWLLLKLGLGSLRQKLIQKRKFQSVLLAQRRIFSSSNIHVVTVSEHAKYAMMSFVPFLKDGDIDVFYSPSTIDGNERLQPCSNEYGKYYLIVSGGRWLKNGARAMLALDQLFSERPDFKGSVVITGLSSLSKISIKLKNPERFKCLDYVDENTLASLYQNAYALIYPSLNEGFGYPPMEAMYRECPVVASATASITEICGDAALYFNPYLVKEIQMRILSMEKQELRTSLIEKGKKRELLIRNRQNADLDKLCKKILSYGN